jgi:hypothetical protein
LLTSNLQIQVGTLCVLVANNTNYSGYDYKTCCLRVQKVLPFKVLLLKGWNGQRWEDHVQNRTCHFLNVDGQIDPFLCCCPYWPLMYVVWTICRSNNYVDVWSMFKRLAYGMPNTTLEWNTSLKQFFFWCTT